MKRMQYEKIWIKRGNCQVISPLAVGLDPILGQETRGGSIYNPDFSSIIAVST